MSFICALRSYCLLSSDTHNIYSYSHTIPCTYGFMTWQESCSHRCSNQLHRCRCITSAWLGGLYTDVQSNGGVWTGAECSINHMTVTWLLLLPIATSILLLLLLLFFLLPLQLSGPVLHAGTQHEVWTKNIPLWACVSFLQYCWPIFLLQVHINIHT